MSKVNSEKTTIVHILFLVNMIVEGKHLPRTILPSSHPSPDLASGNVPFPPIKRLSFYGETCDDSLACVPFSGLTCTNSTCVCGKDYIARLNPGKDVKTDCVVRADSPCGVDELGLATSVNGILERGTSSKRTFSSLWSKLKKSIPFLEGELTDPICVDNARCIQGVCKCSPDHFRDFRGLCLKRRSLFQPCDDDSHCRTSDGLLCSWGKCQCRASMVFDRVSRKCFTPAGAECDAYSSEIDMECVRNSECSDSRCICNNGFTPSSDGTCGVAHGHKCDMKEKPCSDLHLDCRNGRCQCKYSVHQVYNETLDVCLSKPDGPCTPPGLSSLSTLHCVPFAECRPQNDTNLLDHVCKCGEGYAENIFGICEPSYSAPCLEDEDCDQVAQLACLNGKCSCPDEMLVFDWKRRKCVGNVGARCKYIQIERMLSMRVDIPTECVEGAICVENVFRLDGRCECKSGWKFRRGDFKCVK